MILHILTFILTAIIIYHYGVFVAGLMADGHYWAMAILGVLPFIIARYFSTDWERQQDDMNIAAWKHKWRCRLSRLWPKRGDVLPPARKIEHDHNERQLP